MSVMIQASRRPQPELNSQSTSFVLLPPLHRHRHRNRTYTREYVRNLPPPSGGRGRSLHRNGAGGGPRDLSPSTTRSSYEHSSYSSQSSEKSDPPPPGRPLHAFTTSRSHHDLYARGGGGGGGGGSPRKQPQQVDPGTTGRSASRSRLQNSRSYR